MAFGALSLNVIPSVRMADGVVASERGLLERTVSRVARMPVALGVGWAIRGAVGKQAEVRGKRRGVEWRELDRCGLCC